MGIYQASKASVEGEAPSGFAGGGGDASPYKIEGMMELRVAEALSKDVGRGLARLDPKDLEKIGVRVGDLISVTGKRMTAVRVIPQFQEMRGKGNIHIDGITRSNAGISLDEKITIDSVPAHHIANQIVLSTFGGAAPPKDRDLLKILEGVPVLAGDRVRVTLFGSTFQDFFIKQTIPQGVVLVSAETRLSVVVEREKQKPKEIRISYEDIGGLKIAIQRIREIVELPLKYPELFERLGIEAPKGILLHGPPGVGKTLLARAVASETEATFFAISGPEIMHKYYGESEARLREIFEKARRQSPSVIFLDELESIAPKREEVLGEMEKRIVAQLLALLDGLEGRGKIVVIGATNLPHLLDPALRRPGRFDREIDIGIPGVEAREEILGIHTRGMPLSSDVILKKLAEITHGFTGADLEALCREAAITALRRILPTIELGKGEISYDVLMSLRITMDDFLSALREVEPSAIREVSIEVPNVSWKDIGGLFEVKEKLLESVSWPIKYTSTFSEINLRPPKGILLYGPPGTGKTLLARALASQIGINFISVKGPQLLSKYVGESEKAVRETFKKARQAAPCILFLDEIDSLAPKRAHEAGDSRVMDRVVGQLLTEIDGIEELRSVWILAATNRIDILDPALLRPGRFDLLLELTIPDAKGRLEILRIHTKGRPLSAGLNLEEWSEKTEKMTGADLEALCNRATLIAFREFIMMETPLEITSVHFQQAAEEFSRRSRKQVT